MNKKYIAGGLVFWAGLSGYMGLRILESYTEDAVFAALSAVPAQAQEIRYSFLNNTLSLKGVEYELPDDSVMHKGTIESVEVKGFNRKCMFVKPSMPPYDADTLPIVAESISATGIVDKVHVGNTQMEQRIADVQVNGWYQRLGMLLDQRSRHKGEASFFEELYRCRLDGLEVNDVRSVISDPELPVPVKIDMEKAALARGIAAPRGEARVSPLSLYVTGVRFSGDRFSGSLQRMDVKDVLLPSPELMAELVAMQNAGKASEEAAAAEPAGAAADENAALSQEERLEAALAGLYEYYVKNLPVSLFGLQGLKVSLSEGADAMGIAVNGFSYTLAREGEDATKSTTDLSRLHLTLPEKGEPLLAVFSRYAPEGFVLNMKAGIRTGKNDIVSTARYELEGLGELEGECVYSGDLAALEAMPLLLSEDAYLEAVQKLQLKKLYADYKDSGLLPLALEVFALENSRAPEEYATMAVQIGSELERVPGKMFAELGKLMREQFTAPGEMSVAFTSETPVSFMELLSTALMDPASLPFTFGSTPGTKPLAEYLPGQAAEEKAVEPAAPAVQQEPAEPEKPAETAALPKTPDEARLPADPGKTNP
ncbi:hypothetical protein [Mailhella massiliensis]|uniref:hypothetical protein n=1 Tax=Mailhella massiliensis TaxID=1903261 RepID=UPI0023579D39|nr:hypothetical protein [Mailhella massiliensis]